MSSKRASVIKLSPQETRVMAALRTSKVLPVEQLYSAAKKLITAARVPHRAQQQHVGVLIARLNKKQQRFTIKPGGKDHPRTYKLTRRA